MDIADQKLGPEDEVKVSIAGGKLLITNVYQGAQLGATLAISVDAKAFLEMLKVASPGNWDDLVINIVEGALP